MSGHRLLWRGASTFWRGASTSLAWGLHFFGVGPPHLWRGLPRHEMRGPLTLIVKVNSNQNVTTPARVFSLHSEHNGKSKPIRDEQDEVNETMPHKNREDRLERQRERRAEEKARKEAEKNTPEALAAAEEKKKAQYQAKLDKEKEKRRQVAEEKVTKALMDSCSSTPGRPIRASDVEGLTPAQKSFLIQHEQDAANDRAGLLASQKETQTHLTTVSQYHADSLKSLLGVDEDSEEEEESLVPPATRKATETLSSARKGTETPSSIRSSSTRTSSRSSAREPPTRKANETPSTTRKSSASKTTETASSTRKRSAATTTKAVVKKSKADSNPTPSWDEMNGDELAMFINEETKEGKFSRDWDSADIKALFGRAWDHDLFEEQHLSRYLTKTTRGAKKLPHLEFHALQAFAPHIGYSPGCNGLVPYGALVREYVAKHGW